MFNVDNRNLFRLNRIILFYLPWLFRALAKLRKSKKRLLIIKNDAIGDYILFRNFIESIKKSPKYIDYEVDLLGNELWKDIAFTYDAPFIKQFIFTKADELYDAPLKTLKIGWQLFKNNYDLVLQPTYSRTLINDSLAALTGSKKIIGFESNNERIALKYKNRTDKFYSLKIPLPNGVYHEFRRTRYFFESVLGSSISLTAPFINIGSMPKSGIAVHPGAGTFKRGWEKEKFLELIKLISNYTTQTIQLIGGPGEVETGAYIMQNLPFGSVENCINKTSLSQTLQLIGTSALLIANDTGAIHMAVATQTPSVCIVGGGHFDRFVPYPKDAAFKPLCVYEKLPCYHCNWLCIFETAPSEPFPCISIIGVDNVWNAILPLLPA